MWGIGFVFRILICENSRNYFRYSHFRNRPSLILEKTLACSWRRFALSEGSWEWIALTLIVFVTCVEIFQIEYYLRVTDQNGKYSKLQTIFFITQCSFVYGNLFLVKGTKNAKENKTSCYSIFMQPDLESLGLLQQWYSISFEDNWRKKCLK